MPEMLEVEAYRRLAEEAVGRRIKAVEAPDAWYLKGGLTAADLRAVLPGQRVTAARRRGKLLLLDTGAGGAKGGAGAGGAKGGAGAGGAKGGAGAGGAKGETGPTLGLRFGMTGRLFLDDKNAVGELLYSSRRREPAWDRFGLLFTDGTKMVLSDPRRLGGVTLDPDEDRLGPDAAAISGADLKKALDGSAAPLKARLLDQSRLAGIGNLLVDETLWRAGLSPERPAGGLSPAEMRRLHRHMVATVSELSDRGGSHTGDLMESRRPGALCPKDGRPLTRSTVGGRTTWWCPAHQR